MPALKATKTNEKVVKQKDNSMIILIAVFVILLVLGIFKLVTSKPDEKKNELTATSIKVDDTPGKTLKDDSYWTLEHIKNYNFGDDPTYFQDVKFHILKSHKGYTLTVEGSKYMYPNEETKIKGLDYKIFQIERYVAFLKNKKGNFLRMIDPSSAAMKYLKNK